MVSGDMNEKRILLMIRNSKIEKRKRCLVIQFTIWRPTRPAPHTGRGYENHAPAMPQTSRAPWGPDSIGRRLGIMHDHWSLELGPELPLMPFRWHKFANGRFILPVYDSFI